MLDSLDVLIGLIVVLLALSMTVTVIYTGDLVVLHFTAGTTGRSALDTWRGDPARVATAYIVDTDGTIFEVFPPAFWAASP